MIILRDRNAFFPLRSRNKKSLSSLRVAQSRAHKRRKIPMNCSICNDTYKGFGNNAWPINNGRCCAWCDNNVVTPVRIKQYFERRKAIAAAVKKTEGGNSVGT
jgi:hypothetical protein